MSTMTQNEIVKANLKYCMALNNLTAEKIERKTGISARSIKEYMYTGRIASTDSLMKLCKVFGCTPNGILLERKEER